jgi:hypothetical protein
VKLDAAAARGAASQLSYAAFAILEREIPGRCGGDHGGRRGRCARGYDADIAAMKFSRYCAAGTYYPAPGTLVASRVRNRVYTGSS